MAYNLSDRFLPSPKSFTLLDPGAYQNNILPQTKSNSAPFLSNTTRNTQPSARIWTHRIYNAYIPPKIPNCSSMKSKCPRFPYEAFSKEDLEEILCKCGIQDVCECSSEENEPKFVCQRNVQKRLFKGHPPRSGMGGGLSAPSRGDHGFEVNIDGTQRRIKTKVSNESPPFYDARVDESTAFYKGCKWSQWTSKRSTKEQEYSPGPADYTLERKLTEGEICAEAVRTYKRKRSKQLRFIETIHQKNILECRPGPASYSPNMPSDSNMTFKKAKRFNLISAKNPGPAAYKIRRDFDLPISPLQPCLARLPEPSFFGVKAVRFKHQKEEGPSPFSYSPTGRECSIMHCPKAPFGSSSERFKREAIEEDDDFILAEDIIPTDESAKGINACILPTWEFKSKTNRMKPLEKKWYEPSPADMPMKNIQSDRRQQLQYTAPFFSSEGRFQPWKDWLPVFGKQETPGPCYYNLEEPSRCYPAVCRGPLVRTRRFPSATFITPAPNEYNVDRGIETVLATHNHKLNSNIKKQHKFMWTPPGAPRKLTLKEQESLLLDKAITLLDSNEKADPVLKLDRKDTRENLQKKDESAYPKLLRCFLYSNQIPNC